ncbi:hypothetical protein BK139_13310 [Paenibacillus sp. FSL R5-0490]|uniref:hypothetical protein n=1 Tax=Paenibacillus sp. FSL R5-0490 TaxID=1920424 RepID=UPI00096F8408|nr:hypothetical protein [Paenibacillus sp. FSL R5-0490]OMF59370.1 hypothetical protein BK139_13310 [Paenibacillus sp. FSL R5-0490]
MVKKKRIKEWRLSVWELDKDLTLEEVTKNLQLKYNLPIDYLKDRKDLNETEKTLQNGWHPGNGEDSFNIKEISIANNKIRYIHAIGYYEKAESKNKAVIKSEGTKDIIIPRHLRVFNRSCEAVFFELSGKVYTVIEVSPSEAGRVRSVLFGQGRKENKKEEWLKVNYKDVKQFKFDSKFFYWLLSKVGNEFEYEDKKDYKLNLYDVSAVAHSTDQEEYDSTSIGTNILGSLPALSGLGSNQSVYEAGFTFKLPKLSLTLKISENAECFINLDNSSATNDKGESVSVKDDTEYVRSILTIYAILLITLKKAYNSEISGGSWTTSEEESQRKKWGLFVINELCEENNITLEDIKELFKKQEESKKRLGKFAVK